MPSSVNVIIHHGSYRAYHYIISDILSVLNYIHVLVIYRKSCMYALFLSTISKFKESPYDDMDKNR